MHIRTALAGAAAASLLLAGACSSDDDSTTTAADDTAETAAPAAGVTVAAAWARPSPMATGAGAVYLDLTSADADALIGVEVDPSVAAEAQIHETASSDDMDMSDDTMADDSMADDRDTGDGAMSMQEVDSIPLPAGETVALEPGGYHIMLLELAAPLEEGESFEITLLFEEAGEQTVTVAVGEPS